MPVEIKELVIKAEFGRVREEAISTGGTDNSNLEQDELIQECVRQVLDILARKQER